MEVIMYKIRFDFQTESGIPDSESCSIVLTKEQYEALPELSVDQFDENCGFSKKPFPEQVRNPHVSFPALWASNPSWQLEQPEEFERQYNNPKYSWVFVCLDSEKDIWIAFKYWDAAKNEEVMSSSTVRVSTPWHGDVYRLDTAGIQTVKQFF